MLEQFRKRKLCVIYSIGVTQKQKQFRQNYLPLKVYTIFLNMYFFLFADAFKDIANETKSDTTY